MLRQYIDHLAKQGLAPAAVRRYYAPVRALLATAFEDGQIRTNPALGVRVIVRDVRVQASKWLTAEETRALLSEIPAQHSDLAYLLAATGCRISEALGARWADIDGGEWTVRRSKTEAGLRVISLSPETLRRLVVRRSQSAYAGSSDPLFPTRTGTPIDPHNWRQQVFNPAAKRAGVEWATPHKLRHGVASMMARDGYSASEIANYLGHADGGALALKVYVHTQGPAPDFDQQLIAPG